MCLHNTCNNLVLTRDGRDRALDSQRERRNPQTRRVGKRCSFLNTLVGLANTASSSQEAAGPRIQDTMSCRHGHIQIIGNPSMYARNPSPPLPLKHNPFPCHTPNELLFLSLLTKNPVLLKGLLQQREKKLMGHVILGNAEGSSSSPKRSYQTGFRHSDFCSNRSCLLILMGTVPQAKSILRICCS